MMFRNEDEFQAFFIRDFGSVYLGDWVYAKITKIAGEFIQRARALSSTVEEWRDC